MRDWHRRLRARYRIPNWKIEALWWVYTISATLAIVGTAVWLGLTLASVG